MCMSRVSYSYSCLSVTEGQQKQFELETQGTVSLAVERKKLEIGMYCEHLSRYKLQAQTLANWTEKGSNGHLHVAACSELNS